MKSKVISLAIGLVSSLTMSMAHAPSVSYKRTYLNTPSTLCSYSTPVFKGTSDFIRFLNKSFSGQAHGWADVFNAENKEMVMGRKNEFDSKTTISLLTPTLVSGLSTNFYDTGGAHPGIWFFAHNYGYLGGKPAIIRLSDLCKPKTDLVSTFSPAILNELRYREAEWVMNGELTEINPQLLETFILTPTSIVWIIPPYEAGPWAQGTFEIKFPLSKFAQAWNPSGPLSEIIQVSE